MSKITKDKIAQAITACKQYCLAAGATQGNIAYTQNVMATKVFFVNREYQADTKSLQTSWTFN